MTPRVRVKICGITTTADAEAAIEAGADALGFNLFPGSKRYVALAELLPWVRELPPLVSRFAVLVNPTAELARAAGEVFDVLQFHGAESPCECVDFAQQRPWVKGMPLGSRADELRAAEFRAAGAAAVLVDAWVPGAFGGTGELIDLTLAASLAAQPGLRMILAGGLTPENVGAAVRQVRPFAVDVASGVEMAGDARRKDGGRMREFIAAVRAAENG